MVFTVELPAGSTSINRLATGAIFVLEVAALDHELQRTKPRQVRLFIEELRERELSRSWFVGRDLPRVNRRRHDADRLEWHQLT